ncbi:TM2 domain-containing protein [Raineyella fluvialis]|uniref:TM2 domain-containing protein n=1 Tax=Raineyella fluvialis TaxID=2662261 RepID=UPI001E3DDB5A|nr:TM2 domain-containing protein [Raineyella fluvialis]
MPTSPPRDLGLAMLLTAVGFFGVAGLQYFYIGKIGKGVAYLLTAGWVGIGTIVSLFTIGDEVARTNDERRRGLR